MGWKCKLFGHDWNHTHIQYDSGMGGPYEGRPDPDARCKRCGTPAYKRNRYGAYRIVSVRIENGMLQISLRIVATDTPTSQENLNSIFDRSSPFLLEVPMYRSDPLGIAHAKIVAFVRDTELNQPLGTTPA